MHNNRNKLIVVFEVVTTEDLTVDDATIELLKGEMNLNSTSKLRWHLTDVTLKDIKTFVEDSHE